MMLLQKLKRFAYMLLVFIGIGGLAWGQAQSPEYEEGALYVKFKAQSGISAKKMPQSKDGSQTIPTVLLNLSPKITERYPISEQAYAMALFDNEILDHTFLINIESADDATLEKLMRDLEKDPNIEYVERVPVNRIFSVSAFKPNDPFYGKIGRDTLNVSWHLDLINAEKAWELQTGDSNIYVAVVDNAVWGAHEDLQIPSKLQYNCYSNMPGNSAPPTGTPQDETCDTADFYNSTCLSYEFSHGTHCAGAIGAISNNGKGIASIGSGVTLMGIGGPVPGHPANIGQGYRGIQWAASHGAKIISCSWGTPGGQTATTQKAIVQECYDKGIIVIAAAGNDNTSAFHSPSGYYPYVISVGSVDSDKNKSSFSNHGPWVDIMAPGGDDVLSGYKTMIFSTTFCQNQYTRIWGPDDFAGTYYDEMHGTSMAAPVLAGVVSLMASMKPDITTDEVRNILQRTGQDFARGHDSRYNAYCKIVDAYAALKFIKDGFQFGPAIANNDLSAKSHFDTVWLKWKAPQTDLNINGYNIYCAGEIIAEAIQPTADEEQYLSFIHTGNASGDIRFAVEPIYDDGIYSIRTEIDVNFPVYYSISAFIRPDSAAGYVEGAGRYERDQRYTLTPVANPGYTFVCWQDEGFRVLEANSQNQLIDLAKRNRNFFAKFSGLANENMKKLESSLSLSPNPTTDEFRILSPEFEINEVNVCDLQGRVIYQQKADTHNLTISAASWPTGGYMVQITTTGGTISRKLIKQ